MATWGHAIAARPSPSYVEMSPKRFMNRASWITLSVFAVLLGSLLWGGKQTTDGAFELQRQKAATAPVPANRLVRYNPADPAPAPPLTLRPAESPPASPAALPPAAAAGAPRAPVQSVPAMAVKNPKPPIQDPVARAALALVGSDPLAEAYWYDAINDPSLSADERQDLIEDLNEDGLLDPKHPRPEELPLILSRLMIIEQAAPDSMDAVNADAFQEAYKDLLNLAALAMGQGPPVK